eukprot:scaffold1311_cov323-Prasinococcus_capsulatus_cf.AAC.1
MHGGCAHHALRRYLVQNDAGVLVEERVEQSLAQQQAVGDELEPRPAACLVLEAHRVAHLLAQSNAPAPGARDEPHPPQRLSAAATSSAWRDAWQRIAARRRRDMLGGAPLLRHARRHADRRHPSRLRNGHRLRARSRQAGVRRRDRMHALPCHLAPARWCVDPAPPTLSCGTRLASSRNCGNCVVLPLVDGRNDRAQSRRHRRRWRPTG